MLVAYVFGEQIIWAILAFGAGIWAAMTFSGMKVNTTAVVVGAIALALFTQDLNLVFAQDAVTALAILALVVVAMQYLYNVSFGKGVALAVTAWIVGTILLGGIV
ncbi:hypothetical protein AUJ14_05935 [Candidatus Micrarchaeota archaeon CG1_02_55_22]|nr:MAG: hypothetical protein AUJ14_05935 [Candidatus Micrarchaeota archaeon CG1_02_55_22]